MGEYTVVFFPSQVDLIHSPPYLACRLEQCLAALRTTLNIEVEEAAGIAKTQRCARNLPFHERRWYLPPILR